MKKPKFPRAKIYPLMADTVELAVRAGYNKAHKHTDNPSEDVVIDMITRYVTSDLCEAFDFGGEQ